jgi:exodeoxyribonuclease V alpha subunit
MEKIKCTIERVTFQNPENGYSVLQATIKGYREEQTIVGTFHEVTVGAVLPPRLQGHLWSTVSS